MNKNTIDLIKKALEEDEAYEDVSTQAVFSADDRVKAQLVAKEEGILCGMDVFKEVFCRFRSKCGIEKTVNDGEKILPGQVLAEIEGPARVVLSAERTALNFIQHLSGIATLTSLFVRKIQDTKAKIYDTRKTTPGLRELEKYAVRCGGGFNHRMNLKQMAMLKDNHIRGVRDLAAIVRKIKKDRKSVKVEIECQTISEVANALKARADVIMFDNMDMHTLRNAINLARLAYGATGRKPELEISGGVNLEKVQKLAELGVDRISVGALTHSAPSLDISLEIKNL